MTFRYSIPLLQDISGSFQDSFGESKNPIKDARAWIYQILTREGVDWTITLGNGIFTTQIVDKNGRPKIEPKSLKDVDLKAWIPKSDPDWVPELLESGDLQSFDIKIGNGLYEMLSKIIALKRYISIPFNQSEISYRVAHVDDANDKTKRELDHENLDIIRKNAKKFAEYPIEEFLRGMLHEKIVNKVKEHEKKLLDKEYQELYGDEDKPTAEPEAPKQEENSPPKTETETVTERSETDRISKKFSN